jgi:putative ABC transport system permease protein
MGRDITDADVRAGDVVMVNEAAARAWFDGSPIGQQIDLGRPRTVVGVIADARSQSPATDVLPMVYLPPSAEPASRMDFSVIGEAGLTIVVRPRPGADLTASHLRAAVEPLGVPAASGRIRSGLDWYRERTLEPRQRAVLIGSLSALALGLAMIGIFGTTAYAVAGRTHEIGVRMALGASPRQVVRAVVRESAWPLTLGVIVGLTIAVATTRLIASLLFEMAPTDLLSWVIAVLVLAGTALVAAWLPARRAARVDPVAALRAE